MVNRPPSAGQTSETKTSMVDLGVYSKNRHFRLLLSSKGGKPYTLQPHDRVSSVEGLNPQHRFMISLICNVHPDAKLLPFGFSAWWPAEPAAQQRVLADRPGAHAAAPHKHWWRAEECIVADKSVNISLSFDLRLDTSCHGDKPSIGTFKFSLVNLGVCCTL